MKIHNISSSRRNINNSKTSFKGGLRAVQDAVMKADVAQITDKFTKLGIDVNFANNPIIAACSGFATDIFLRLGLKPPTSIYAVPFSRISGNKMGANVLGFCLPDTSALTKDCKGLEKMFQKRFNIRSVFFNTDVNWANIDMNANFQALQKQFSTPHFLHTFIHEFCHNAHVDHIYRTYGYHSQNSLGYRIGTGGRLWNKLHDTPIGKYSPEIISNVSSYAKTNPMELVAENMTELIARSLNPQTMRPQTNPFTFSAFVNGTTIDEIFKKAWHGIL